jgi:hypothetical protein
VSYLPRTLLYWVVGCGPESRRWECDAADSAHEIWNNLASRSGVCNIVQRARVGQVQFDYIWFWRSESCKRVLRHAPRRVISNHPIIMGDALKWAQLSREAKQTNKAARPSTSPPSMNIILHQKFKIPPANDGRAISILKRFYLKNSSQIDFYWWTS